MNLKPNTSKSPTQLTFFTPCIGEQMLRPARVPVNFHKQTEGVGRGNSVL